MFIMQYMYMTLLVHKNRGIILVINYTCQGLFYKINLGGGSCANYFFCLNNVVLVLDPWIC